MGVRLTHTHPDGKRCYLLSSRSPGGYSRAGLYLLSGQELLVAYLGYTGHWYAFNAETGRELGTFTREFYDTYLATLRVGDFVPDPDCVPGHVGAAPADAGVEGVT